MLEWSMDWQPPVELVISLNATVGVQRCVFTPVEETGGWSLNWVIQTWMCVYKQMGTWISLDHQDNGGNPFGLQPVFALLSLWEHTGMERLQRNEI